MEITEASGFVQAARFKRDAAAKRVYTAIQELLRQADCELSVYNVRLDGEPTVVVLGERPVAALDTQIQGALAAGTRVPLPGNVVRVLAARRAARQHMRWSEGHYGAGKRIV